MSVDMLLMEDNLEARKLYYIRYILDMERKASRGICTRVPPARQSVWSTSAEDTMVVLGASD